jgi:hypothetical protein
MYFDSWQSTGLAILMLAVMGCGDGRPARVPVSGTVLIDGHPLKHGEVRFIPDGARMSEGVLDENGRFVLGCFEKEDGAVLGQHAVVVEAAEGLNSYTTRWHAPKKYADRSQSGLSQSISEPTSSVMIELSWSGGQPFDEVDEGMREEQRRRRKPQ